ncbi:hypothetical protein AB4342_18510 [Vibrio breoganii]|nr:hypothetical protein [Vibrio breoganii]PMG07569.1 hypothetical protein BCV00_07595 [Vibrio breoganii]PMJ45315.1 hypothetical protein BCU21_13635 [Vibrio breoganii]PMK59429.1 hypothetical protein BCT97_06475 [Vibrio breoganii]PMM79083.1 hypothetical protein BCT45_17050 [Vibrio breoganii]PMO29228.1 hypothetical protein BCT14_06650 [Vibrio breoganii]
MANNFRVTSVNELVNILAKLPELKVSAYKLLVEEVPNELRVQAYKICMQDRSLAHHAMGIQSTYFAGIAGGFEENIGGNGSMGAHKMRQQRK